jgi:polar amino acid transport system permease protein
VLALSLNAGAYGSEIVRAALQAVPREQREAGVALNLTRYQSIRHVVLPQAVVMMLPSLGNLAIELMKGTAVVSLISIADLTFQAQTIRVQTGNTAIPFLASLALYFAFASVISLLFGRLERHLGKGHEGVGA